MDPGGEAPILDEDTDAVLRKFLSKEMHISNVDELTIPRAHRIGFADRNKNRSIIAKFVFDSDIRKIFNNVSILKGTQHSINTQLPPEINERRQFGWKDYKSARARKTPARFNGGQLIIRDEPVVKYDPVALPAAGDITQGKVSAIADVICGDADSVSVNQYTLNARSMNISSLQDVRDAQDSILHHDTYIRADSIAYAFRYIDVDGSTVENFESDGESGAGLNILRCLVNKNAENVACFVAIQGSGKIGLKAKSEAVNSVVNGSLLALQHNTDT